MKNGARIICVYRKGRSWCRSVFTLSELNVIESENFPVVALPLIDGMNNEEAERFMEAIEDPTISEIYLDFGPSRTSIYMTVRGSNEPG